MKLHERLTVTYSVSLVLFEESGKKYFKNAPITLYRKLKEWNNFRIDDHYKFIYCAYLPSFTK